MSYPDPWCARCGDPLDAGTSPFCFRCTLLIIVLCGFVIALLVVGSGLLASVARSDSAPDVLLTEHDYFCVHEEEE